MNEHQLSKRLAEVANLVPNGCRLADIGSDHAYLPAYLILQGKIAMAIAGEVNEGPFQAAQKQVERLSLDSVLEVRKGDGLEVIEIGEVDVLVLAGMGASLIVRILNDGYEKLAKIQRMIVQPNVGGNLLRQWFLEQGWQLKEEKIIEEDGQFYEILMAEPGNARTPYFGLTIEEHEQAILMGPFLLQERKPAFIKKWKSELEKRRKIISSLRFAAGLEKEEKVKEISKEVQMIEEGLSK